MTSTEMQDDRLADLLATIKGALAGCAVYGLDPGALCEELGNRGLTLLHTETLSEMERRERELTESRDNWRELAAGDGPRPEPMWCVFEQMGRNRYPCKLTVEEMAGIETYRLDVPDGDGWVTTYVRPGTMYAIRPCSEDVVRRIAAHTGPPEPAHPWELKAIEKAGPEPAEAYDGRRTAHEAYGDGFEFSHPGDDYDEGEGVAL